MENFETQQEIIQSGLELFKKREPHPHIDKKSFEEGAKYAFDFAMQEFRTLILDHFGYDDPLYEDEVDDLINRFLHQLGYEEYK